MNKAFKKIIAFFLSLTLVTGTIFYVYAYYTEYAKSIFDSSVEVELLFDKLSTAGDINSPLNQYQQTLSNYQEYKPDAVWGSDANPYVISDIKYLENLSTLQNSGYFDRNYYKTTNDIPHFLVCTAEYTPVIIDGTDKKIAPVGTDKYPFIGSIKGVSKSGTSIAVGKNHQADISTIYNIKIDSNNENHDIGLFSNIGHTGDKSITESTTDSDGKVITTFNGTPSVISDILLVDVQVESSHSLIDNITEWFSNHIPFLSGEYDDKDGNHQTDGAKDTHHIGIFAGHIEYAEVKNISVFYTEDTVCAINLKGNATGSKSNFYSSTGIIGLADNINPVFKDGKITLDSGIGNDLNYNNSTGGGKLSGGKEGIVNAAELYDIYKYDSQKQEVSTTLDEYSSYGLKGLYTKDTEQLVQKKTMSGLSIPLLGINWGKKDYYYFYDGVFTFALSNTSDGDTIKNIWKAGTKVPDIICSENWEYGQLDSYGYFATLTPVKNAAEISATDDYIICYFTPENKFIALNPLDSTSSLISDNAAVFDGTNYELNLGKNTNALDKSKIKAAINNSLINFSAKNETGTAKLGVKATGSTGGIVSNLAISLSYSDIAENTGNIGLTADKTRYTYGWSLSNSIFSINANYSKYGFLNYTCSQKNQYLIYNNGFGLSDTSPADINSIMLCKVSVVQKNYDNGDPDAPKGFIPTLHDNIYPANEYVLEAADEFSNSIGANNNTLSYNLKKISDLKWKSYDGNSDISTVEKQFSLKDGIDIGNVRKWLGMTYYEKGIINAPIGSDGTSTDMPTGTIAFKVNKLGQNGEAKVNVIVAADDNNNQSFGIWKVDTTQGFFGTTTNFDKNKPLKSFVIPNTRTLKDTDTEEYINVNINGNTMRSYLNGDTVLVSHTFTITETGVYIMGATSGAMNICYFSAEGVASAAESQIGSIDFVYSDIDLTDNKYKIIPVNQVPLKDENGNYQIEVNETNYNQFYYPSLMFPFTNQAANPTSFINFEELFIKRHIKKENNAYNRYIDVTVNSDTVSNQNKYIDISLYSISSDNGTIIYNEKTN